jgi:hypothetical protein
LRTPTIGSGMAVTDQDRVDCGKEVFITQLYTHA